MEPDGTSEGITVTFGSILELVGDYQAHKDEVAMRVVEFLTTVEDPNTDLTLTQALMLIWSHGYGAGLGTQIERANA